MSAAVAHGPLTRLWATLGKLRKAAGLGADDADDVLRIIVHQVSGQQSTRGLNSRQVQTVIERLEERIGGSRPAGRPSAPGDVGADGRAVGPAAPDASVTPEQSRALLAMSRTLGMSHASLREWIQGRMKGVCGGMPWPQTRDQAERIHEGLEAMLWRRPENKADAVLARVRHLLTLTGLSDWERTFVADLERRMGRVEEVAPQRKDQSRRKNTRMPRRSWKQLTKLAEIESKYSIHHHHPTTEEMPHGA